MCRSQLHGIEGDWKDHGIPPGLPTVPGHEIVGSVMEVGEKVTKFKIKLLNKINVAIYELSEGKPGI